MQGTHILMLHDCWMLGDCVMRASWVYVEALSCLDSGGHSGRNRPCKVDA